MKVLVTSSTGLTGRAVVKALADSGAEVRAMIHRESHRAEMLALGASEAIVASIESENDIARLMEGVDAVFYICPTAHPREGIIGRMAVDIAERSGIKRFVYQSVHNSMEQELPHHRQKLMVEQHLIISGLNYSILRPAAFMQNILSAATQLREKYIFVQRFYKSTESENRINLIDVKDYAAIATKVVLEDKYDFGCYDICGLQNLSASDMVSTMSDVIGHAVTLHYTDDDEFIAMATKRNMPENTINTLLAMFRAYNQFGFKGNSLTAETLLGRKPNSFRKFLAENL